MIESIYYPVLGLLALVSIQVMRVRWVLRMADERRAITAYADHQSILVALLVGLGVWLILIDSGSDDFEFYLRAAFLFFVCSFLFSHMAYLQQQIKSVRTGNG